MVDILSLELTLNLVATHPPTTGSLNKWLDEPVRSQVRLVKVKGGVTIGHLRVTNINL